MIVSNNKRFICYMDIMGFKDLVYRNSHEHVTKKLSNLITDLERMKNTIKDPNDQSQSIEASPEITVFSDTIVLISKEDTPNDLAGIISASIAVYLLCMLNGLPVKGAMAHGKITFQKEISLLVGRALVDVYELANETFYYGIVAHHTLEKKLISKGFKDIWGFYPKNLPMKGGNIKHYHLLVKEGLEIACESVNRSTNDLIDLWYSSVSGNTRKYVDNTIIAHELQYSE